MTSGDERPLGQVDALRVPRYAGEATFARLPRLQDVGRADVSVVGVPFDAGVTYRPGARFGPASIRQASRLLRPYHADLGVHPFAGQQVADAGDVACNPFDIGEALGQIEAGVAPLLVDGRVVVLGGDHTVALPVLRAVTKRFGPVALVHFDAHLDTWDTYFGAPYTHGTPFRRAFEEGLLLPDRSVHVGTRGSIYADADLVADASFGFSIIRAHDIDAIGVPGVVDRIRSRVGDAVIYVSVDIDVLDPAHAPGTGTPEAGGLSSRELLGILRGLAGLRIASCDVVEVSPPYDHADITSVAAANVAYDMVALMALQG